jgi:hypothetical protein
VRTGHNADPARHCRGMQPTTPLEGVVLELADASADAADVDLNDEPLADEVTDGFVPL